MMPTEGLSKEFRISKFRSFNFGNMNEACVSKNGAKATLLHFYKTSIIIKMRINGGGLQHE